MTKWTLQSEKPIHETHRNGLVWIQLDWEPEPKLGWVTGPDPRFHTIYVEKINSPINPHHIVAWQPAEWTNKPLPYKAPKPTKDLVGTWMDGSKEEPGAFEWHYLIQVKAEKKQRYAEYLPTDKVFNDVLKYGVFHKEEVWWLKLEDKKEDDDDE